MHEWALAEAVISSLNEIADREGLREVREVHLRIGELQQVDGEILLFALSQMKSGKLANAKFILKTSRARFKCRVCGHKWFLREVKAPDEVRESIHFIPEAAYAYLRCPKCNSPDFEVSSGRGLWIASVRGVK
jgi:hydrogenase nickel incorporation protein HypA/HybF